MTLSSPTRARPRRDSATRDAGPTAERLAWPEHAEVASLLSIGVPYADAWHMSPLDSRRLLAIAQADSIPPGEREGGDVMGTAADARKVLASF